jgi:uncharacterized membrane protein YgcG
MSTWKRVLAVGSFVVGLAITALILINPWKPGDTGWTINSFHSDIMVNKDSTLTVIEDIQVNFADLEKHGIYRTIPIRYRYDNTRDRLYDLQVQSVTIGPPVNGNTFPWLWQTSIQNDNLVIQIGDKNRLVSGKQRYYITYTVAGAMNSFSDHDELYWNVDGGLWPVSKSSVVATVHVPSGSFQKAACYEGATGSSEPCTQTTSATAITYTAKHALASGEELTVVAALRKGVVSVPPPTLGPRARYFPHDTFDINPLTVGVTALLLIVALTYVGWSLLAHGRDRAYLGQYYLINDPKEDASPLLARVPVVVEFTPPDNLKPAELGVLLDEHADNKDITGTVVHLAVQGYLTITETQDGDKDWILTRISKAPDGLLPYEATILGSLFAKGQDTTRLSDLKSKSGFARDFADALSIAEGQLYDDAVNKEWFWRQPDTARWYWGLFGAFLALVGAAAAYVLGVWQGWGLIGTPLVLAGLLFLATTPFTSFRTGRGRALMLRALGFRLYINTAEKYRQQFAANAGIFTQGLPYAIVFGCVNKWANAFDGVDTSAYIRRWYVGNGAFAASSFSSSLQAMNAGISSAISYSSGGSGFGGGGGSGGGGGGGGGGSW